MTLVSVITPTWERHALLQRCIKSVRQQTWPEIQHVIVSDGPDAELADTLDLESDGGSVVYAELPDHRPELSAWGSRARNHGLSLATGKLIAYLDDDNAFKPEHLATLVDALMTHPKADFAYAQMKRHRSGLIASDIIGSAPPQYGGIDTSLIMHRAGLPQRLGMWPSPVPAYADQHAPDWVVVDRWLKGGASWVHVPWVTVDYYFANGK